jgi:choline dehydrogenase
VPAFKEAYDYVIVGGGSAGCVLANRLSADESVSVLLLEAGPRDRGLMMEIPAAVYRVYQDPAINWNYMSEPEVRMNNRRISVPRGKVLGGSSSINAMVYLRGNPKDYDNWSTTHGLRGWSYADCLPYFRRSECSDRGAGLYHGTDGPLHVEQGRLKSEIFDAFLDASADAGHLITDDLNGARPEGIGRMDSTRQGGRRCSASVAFLRPIRHRRNLQVVTGIHVTKILFAGKRASGVAVAINTGKAINIQADREVLLCAGAINSPQLLMLSGIGPEDDLRKHNIPIIHRAENVGRNLQDHLNVGLKFTCKKSISLSWLDKPAGKAYAGAKWLLNKSGPAASNIWEVGGFIRSSEDVDYPNFQYHVGPVLMSETADGFKLTDGVMVHMAQLRQESRGRVQLRSDDPRKAPVINFNFFSTDRDKSEFRGALSVTRDIMNRKPMADIGATEVLPGGRVTSTAAIDEFISAYTNTEFHPSCTCRMGVDEAAVVDGELRVNGIDGLRVVDASVMPQILSCNLNAPTIMIAERAADMILGKPQLAKLQLAQAPFPASGTELRT